MSSENVALRHSAFVYDAEDDYVNRSVAFIRDGPEAGEGCIVAHSRDWLAIMRDALGPDAEGVTFVDVGSTYMRAGAGRGGLLRNLPRSAPTAALGTRRRRAPVQPRARGLGRVDGVRGHHEPRLCPSARLGGVHVQRQRAARPGRGRCVEHARRGADRPVARERALRGSEGGGAQRHARAQAAPAAALVLGPAGTSSASASSSRSSWWQRRCQRSQGRSTCSSPAPRSLPMPCDTAPASRRFAWGAPTDGSCARSSTVDAASMTRWPVTSPRARERAPACGSRASWPGSSSPSTRREASP